ncbi:MAG: hypothetical protein HQ567_11760 [Candidatus Nealsonbacteria bacterium]|nr:hypothetical protein [Candidatus Nealsonbacteria bacterium]
MTPAILSRLKGTKKNGSGWTARCPAHEDNRSSLSVGCGDDGRTLLHCHAGCKAPDVVAALGLEMKDLMPSTNGNGRAHRARINDQETGLVKLLADAICDGNHFAQDQGGTLYRYARGAYRTKADRYVKGRVKALCEDWKATGRWSSRLSLEVVEYIRVDAPELWERPPRDVVNVANGLLRVKARALLPHSPDHLSAVQLPINYDATATCPCIENFVADVFPDDAHDLAWQSAAWVMVPDTSIQKAILTTGEGCNGKSVYLSLLTRFVGKSNTSGVALHRLESDKFSTARLVGKLANICPDLPSEHLAGTSVFKAITGGDALAGEHKFRESFEFTPFCKLIFSANHPPRSADASPAFFRRWLVIPFDRTFSADQQIPREQLDAMLTTPGELSGMLNKALDALDLLRKRCAFSEPESVRAAWQDFHATTDPLAVWLDANTIDHPDAFVSKAELRAQYNAHATNAGQPTLGTKAFGGTLRKLRPDTSDAQRTVGGRYVWCYTGIGIRE